MASSFREEPWEHPDWYDLHDTTWTAGPEREPEHYRELVIALPPLDYEDHLVDLGAGTGKIACAIGRAYPRLGRVSLVEPNEKKLERAVERVRETLPNAEIRGYPIALGFDGTLPDLDASVVTVGSVFMPVMELWSGSLGSALDWLKASLEQTSQDSPPGRISLRRRDPWTSLASRKPRRPVEAPPDVGADRGATSPFRHRRVRLPFPRSSDPESRVAAKLVPFQLFEPKETHPKNSA